MKHGIIFNVIGSALLITGIGILVFAHFVRTTNAAQTAQPIVAIQPGVMLTPLQPETRQGKATSLSIPEVSIQNDVIDGVFDSATSEWTLTKDKVQFATITRQPNDTAGLTFMYGHNRNEVFTRLPKVQPGALATVTTENGYIFTYRFVRSTITDPADASIFSYDGEPILVLQTCVGLFYEKRQLFTFEFIGVERA